MIGGGPAGLAAAIAARLEQFDVTLADPRTPPIDKACGEGIMPDGVEILSKLGVHIPSSATFPFHGIRYVEGGIVADARLRGTPGLAMCRTVLHEALHRRARELGVKLLWGQKVRHVSKHSVVLDSGPVPARWIIAADGANSRVRRDLGLDAPPMHARHGLRRHYQITPWFDQVEVHWSNGCEMYVTGVSDHQVCIAALTGELDLKFDAALERFPDLARRLQNAPVVGDTLGGVSIYRRLPAVVRDNVALIGDASGSVDAITGDGVALALQQSMALARALRAGDLSPYAREHRSVMRLPNHMTGMMLAIHHRPRLRRWVMHALSTIPGLFTLLLAIHTRAYSKWRAQDAAPANRPRGPVATSNVLRREPTAAPVRPPGRATSAQGRSIFGGAVLLLTLCLAGAPPARAAEQVLRLDPKESRIEFLLDAMLHKVKGIVRLSHGEIIFDLETGAASGEIVADAPSADTDNRKRNEKMHDKVLLSETHPEIAFYPKSITGSLEPGGESEISLTGSLVLLGEKHELLLPTHVKMDGDRLTGTASFVVPYVSWGLKDPSVFLLRVRKTVDVTLILSGTLGTPDLPTAKQDSTDLSDTATTARSSATPPRNNL